MSFSAYFRGQLKRIIRLFPQIFALSVVFAVVIGICGTLYATNNNFTKESKKYSIGIMCETDDELVKIGLRILKSFDDVKYLIDIKEYGSEQAGFDALHRNEISAFAVIPQSFIDDMNNLRTPDPIALYSASNKGITTAVMGEVADIISDDIIYSEAGILAYDDVLRLNGVPDYERYALTDEFFLRYMLNLWMRGEFTETEVVGISDGLSLFGYIFSGMVLFYTVMLSFCCISFFLGRKTEFNMIAASKGVNAFYQIIGEYISFLLANILSAAFTLLCVFIVLASDIITIPEFTDDLYGTFVSFAASYFWALLGLTAFEFMLFEIIGGIINKFLLAFMVLLCTSFLSGYFYPEAFLPVVAEHVGGILPTGIALDAVSLGLAGKGTALTYVYLILYAAVFIAAATLSRKIRIEKGSDS